MDNLHFKNPLNILKGQTDKTNFDERIYALMGDSLRL